MSEPQKIPQGTKTLLELGPVLVFILIISLGSRFGLEESSDRFVVATIFLIPLAVCALAYIWLKERKTPWMLLVSTLFLSGFGLITILTGDPKWVKIKVTIVNAAFALALGAAYIFSLPILKALFGQALTATDAQWRRAAGIMAIGFLLSAILNEFMWRNLTDVQWAWGAKGGLAVLSFGFTIWAMFPIIRASMAAQEDAA